MITQIKGTVTERKEHSLIIDMNGFCYEVMVPPAVMHVLEQHHTNSKTVTLFTYHYYQMDPSRAIPVLIGFLNEIEKEFFEQFITVSGVGPKAACKALKLPFSSIADAIDKADVSLLKTLPGIGEQRAREIIAKLQGKVGKFGLIQDRTTGRSALKMKDDVKQEALSVLLQLQYKKKEAEQMIASAFERNQKISTCEQILNEVYRQRTK